MKHGNSSYTLSLLSHLLCLSRVVMLSITDGDECHVIYFHCEQLISVVTVIFHIM
jgi:hypothetical protein